MIYVFFAHGFEEVEAITAVDVLRRAELEVRTVGVGAKTVTGSHGITVHCDMIDHAASPKGLEMVVLPGGMPGTLNLEKSPHVSALVDHAAANGIWLGAICAAPSILGHKGLLAGRTVTCFPGYESQLGDGANHTGAAVEVDGKIVTANGAGNALPFAVKLVECLAGQERAASVRAAMQ